MLTTPRKILCACAVVLAVVCHPLTAPAAGPQESTAPAASPAPRAFLDQYCVTCHNERLRTAGLLLDTIDDGHVGASPATWEQVVRKLRSGAMPPAGRRRPDEPTLDAFATWLETELDREAAAHPDPGRPADHRLNRFEYGNAIRDLLALEVDPGSLLPPDESDHGLDNIAEVLSMSPTLLERYMLAARKVSRLAVGDPTTGPEIATFNLSRGLRQDERMSEQLPYGTRGGTLIRHYFPLDGDYVLKIRLGKNFTSSKIRAIETREEIDVLLDGAPVTRFSIGGKCVGSDDPECIGTGYYRTSRYDLTADEALEVRFPATAGMHALGVAFVKKSVLTEGPAPTLLPPRHTSSTYEAPRMDVDYVRLEGPYDPTGPGDTPSRRRIFTCRPVALTDEQPCAKQLLTTLARRAYRRPVTDQDVETLLAFYEAGRDEGGLRARDPGSADASAGVAGVPLPDRARPGRQHSGRGLPDQRPGAGLPVVVLPVEQHPGRSAAQYRSAGDAQGSGRPGERGLADDRRPARLSAGEELRRAVAARPELESRGPRRQLVSRVRRQPARLLPARDRAVSRKSDARGSPARRTPDRRLYLRERAAGALLRDPERLRGAFPTCAGR